MHPWFCLHLLLMAIMGCSSTVTPCSAQRNWPFNHKHQTHQQSSCSSKGRKVEIVREMKCSPTCLCSTGSGRMKFNITCNELCLRIYCSKPLNLYWNIKDKWQKNNIFSTVLVDSRTCKRCFSCVIYSWIIVIGIHGGKNSLETALTLA